MCFGKYCDRDSGALKPLKPLSKPLQNAFEPKVTVPAGQPVGGMKDELLPDQEAEGNGNRFL